MAKAIALISGRHPLEIPAGDTSYVRAHARAIIQLGFEPHIFCVSERTEVVETDFGIIHCAASPFRPFRFIMLPFHGPLIVDCLEKFLLEREGPHLIQGFGVWGQVGVSVSRRLRRRGIDVTTIINSYTTMADETRSKVRGVMPTHGWLRRLLQWIEHGWCRLVIERYEQQVYREARLVLVNYESVRQAILARFDCAGLAGRIRRVSYSAESVFLHSEPKTIPELPRSLTALQSPEAPLIIAVSRHDARKGLDVLLHALARLRDLGIAFRACLVGHGVLIDAHRRLAEQLNLTGLVTIEGRVPDPFDYLQHGDIFVLPSIQEGSGSVSMLEAMQAGLAIVASNIDGIPEDVVDGESALLVEPGNAVALSQAIGQLIADPCLRQRLASCARQRYEGKFSAEALIEASREIYRELGFEVAR